MDAKTPSRLIRFGDFSADLKAGELHKRGLRIKLPGQSFQILVMLLKRPGDVITREEVRKELWPNDTIVEFDHSIGTAINKLRQALGDDAAHPRYVETLTRRGFRLMAAVEQPPTAPEAIRALAVLPLANLTGDPQQEYFADGMAEALISALAKIRSLKVISRTSVMHYKQADKRLPEIAHELGVEAVIEGAVTWTGARVRVSAQLVRAATDEHLWAESYDRELGDVLALHADLARAIASQIRAVLTPGEERRLKSQYRVDPAAHEAMLRGRYFYAKLTAQDLDQAIAWFEQAISRDPAFAEAYAGLAQACIIRGVPLSSNLTGSEQRRLLTQAKTSAQQALELDEALAEAHAALGFAVLFHDWDWRGAEHALERALDLEPNHPDAHAYRAVLASMVGDCGRTLAEIRMAIELDPVNLLIRAEAGEVCYWIRDYAQAIAYASQTLELDPSYPRAHFVLGRVFEAQGRIDEAITQHQLAGMISTEEAKSARRALEQNGAAGYHRWALSVRLGGMANRLADEAGAAQIGDRPFFRGRIYARLGEVDDAMRCLEQAYEERECLLALLKAQEWWDPLRSDPRFQDLLRRVAIP